MAVNLVAPKSLMPVKGVRLASLEANIRYKDRDDLTLIELAEGSSVAGVFTQNAFCAAPVTLCRENLASLDDHEDGIRYLVINAGNANAGTGEEGMTSAQMICAEIADETMTALNSALAGIGATGCALGNQTCSGNKPALTPKPMINRALIHTT